ncbi:hypothetical protein SSX86_027069 [Deinandra increscens subsp. villosa]|uniref:Calcyclin-binding protein n=1 Tax=Deinandra increscens subsp. villosa TaxID=3103831 RepID=A0AAP0CKT8_9ASTR
MFHTFILELPLIPSYYLVAAVGPKDILYGGEVDPTVAFFTKHTYGLGRQPLEMLLCSFWLSVFGSFRFGPNPNSSPRKLKRSRFPIILEPTSLWSFLNLASPSSSLPSFSHWFCCRFAVIVNMADDLSLDLEELRHLQSIAKRPHVVSLISSEIRNLEKQANDAASVASIPTPTPTPVSTNLKVATEPALKYTTLGSFSWDQDNDKVKIYVFLEGVDQEKVQTEFNPMSVDVKFHGVEGKNYRCAIPKLNKEIIPEKCKVLVKPTRVIITLVKASKGNWLDLHFKEDKIKPNLDKERDPMAGIMDLMKNMYEEGDDEMKKTIAKAWTDSRSGKMADPMKSIPVIDLSCPDDAKNLIVKACEDYGFFKVINHGVPLWLVSELEDETMGFFNMSQSEKDKYESCPPNRLSGYRSNTIGQNGDVGWIEYLLFTANDFSSTNSKTFSSLAKEYVEAVRKLGCEILELVAEGLKIEPKSVLSRMLSDDKADTIFRLNHYPPCPDPNPSRQAATRNNPIGFGEHTDPHIISVARSNTTSGLQICLPDGSWVAVPPDHTSFFINVDDLLQVMTNGRFKSVKHRVVTDTQKSRVSMIYFGGPPLMEKISPLGSLMEPGEESLYHEFTWFEYKSCTFKTRLADDRLSFFHKGCQHADHP